MKEEIGKLLTASYLRGETDGLKTVIEFAEAMRAVNGPQLTDWLVAWLTQSLSVIERDQDSPRTKDKMNAFAKSL